MMNKEQANFRIRNATNWLTYILVCILTLLTILPLGLIITQLVKKGAQQFNLSLITESTPTSMEAMVARMTGDIIPGGILNGITGTLLMVGLAMVIAIPIGILAGIYMAEKKGTVTASLLRTIANILQGIPSIICGIVVYMWVVKQMHTYSALAGGVSLAIMMLPMIARTTEESILMVPSSLKEAALALGGSYTRVILTVILPSALSGVVTGALLAISRVMGETAPLLVTALGSQHINFNPNQPTSSISLLIWEFYNDPNLADMVWSSSLLLLFIILGMNLLAKQLAKTWNQ